MQANERSNAKCLYVIDFIFIIFRKQSCFMIPQNCETRDCSRVRPEVLTGSKNSGETCDRTFCIISRAPEPEVNTISAELRCRADLGLEEMDESSWMKFTNTRHLSPLVTYKQTYQLVICPHLILFLYYVYFNWTSVLQFCSFPCFFIMFLWIITITVPHFPLAWLYFHLTLLCIVLT